MVSFSGSKTAAPLARRERPELAFGTDGRPEWLYNGVETLGPRLPGRGLAAVHEAQVATATPARTRIARPASASRSST